MGSVGSGVIDNTIAVGVGVGVGVSVCTVKNRPVLWPRYFNFFDDGGNGGVSGVHVV
ncbi:MAG: hypothetical protein ACNYWM_07445 [Methanosarcinales archaeon]